MKKAILKTLAYADVFDYPLTAEEIWKYLIIEKRVSFKDINRELERPNKLFETSGEFFFLKNRQEIVKIRKKREKWSLEKFKIARRAAAWLRLIPAIKMVSITGALAMNNSDKDDDIDFLIVAAKNRLWLTRLLTVFLMELVEKRRRPGDKNFCDKICLNMFLDEAHLQMSKQEQDLFTAHEIAQLKPIWEKNDIYNKLVSQNTWVKKFLANGLDTKILGDYDIKGKNKNPLNILISQYLNILENLTYKIQLAYMKSRKTIEITDPGRIRFHPQDCRARILTAYNKRLKEIGIR